MNRSVLAGLVSAVLFGVSTPLAKILVSSVHPLWLAALLYLGAGIGLALVLAVRLLVTPVVHLAVPSARAWGWTAAAVFLGGVIAPLALTYGLVTTGGGTASMLLNLESVLTALIAWFLFKENFDGRIAVGMTLIVVGAALLTTSPFTEQPLSPGPLLIALACLCWALDNNLTRKAATGDAQLLASVKGIVAGSFNAVLAVQLTDVAPQPQVILAIMVVGFLGYGVSLALFILSLRDLGAARAGAYFSVAPFFGAAFAVAIGQEPFGFAFLAAGCLMGMGVWLHVSERHAHPHIHDAIEHAHPHTHDAHHTHEHAHEWNGAEPHTHLHAHLPITHSHPHYPDIHHRHPH